MRAAAEIYSLRHLSQGQGVPADTPFCFFQGPLLLNGLKKSFVCPNGNQQDRITNDLVLAGSQRVKDAGCHGTLLGLMRGSGCNC